MLVIVNSTLIINKKILKKNKTKQTKRMKFLLENAVIKHKLSLLRSKDTPSYLFRDLIDELTTFVLSDAAKDLTLEQFELFTPTNTTPAVGYRLKEKVAIVPILRAGLGMVHSALRMFNEAEVYHIGMYRDKRSLQPVEYYNKLPNEVGVDIVYVVDPMIATGGTMIATINVLKSWGAAKICVVALVVSQAALTKISEAHPDIKVFACVVDDELDSKGYIVPGLGDAGDRQFNTHHH
jgi:uracil phosphoribosyltransferase